MLKRNKWLWTVLVLALALLLPGAAAAREGSVVEGDINKAAGSLEVPRNTTINGNVTVNMGEITVIGVVNGNVTGNMGKVSVIGDVNGNVEANMGQIIITGNVSGDVRARMGELIVDGVVAGNLESDLGEVRVRGTVGGDVVTGLGELRIPGEVLGSVSSRGKIVRIDGTVEGDVYLARGIVELGPAAVVGGRVYVEQGLVRVRDGAVVGSLVVEEELTESEIDRLFRTGTGTDSGYTFHGVDDIVNTVIYSVERALRGARIAPNIQLRHAWRFLPFDPWLSWPARMARGLFNMVILFALSALTFTLFPRQVHSTGQAITDNPGPVFGWGLLAVALAIPLMVLLAITIIGIPLIIVEVALLAVAGILGYTAVSQLVGNKIVSAASGKPVSPIGAIALGVLILGALSMVPLVGGLLSLVVFIAAVGATLATRFGSQPPAPASPGGPREE